MDGIILEQGEFLLLLDAVNASTLIGIDEAQHFAADLEVRRRLALDGMEILSKRGWLIREGDKVLLNPDLVIMIGTVAHPDIVLIVTRDTPNEGRREYLYYRSSEAIVEFTMPELGQFRLAALPNLEAMIERITFLLSNPGAATNGSNIAFTINQDVFFQLTGLSSADGQTALQLLAANGITGASAQTLTTTLESPLLSGSVAMLRVEDDKVVDARNLALLLSPSANWTFRQTTPGEPLLLAETAGALDLARRLVDLFLGLIESMSSVDGNR